MRWIATQVFRQGVESDICGHESVQTYAGQVLALWVSQQRLMLPCHFKGISDYQIVMVTLSGRGLAGTELRVWGVTNKSSRRKRRKNINRVWFSLCRWLPGAWSKDTQKGLVPSRTWSPGEILHCRCAVCDPSKQYLDDYIFIYLYFWHGSRCTLRFEFCLVTVVCWVWWGWLYCLPWQGVVKLLEMLSLQSGLFLL